MQHLVYHYFAEICKAFPENYVIWMGTYFPFQNELWAREDDSFSGICSHIGFFFG